MNLAEAYQIERDANPSVDQLLDIGAWYHDKGEFNRAARVYEKIARKFPEQNPSVKELAKKLRKLAKEIGS